MHRKEENFENTIIQNYKRAITKKHKHRFTNTNKNKTYTNANISRKKKT